MPADATARAYAAIAPTYIEVLGTIDTVAAQDRRLIARHLGGLDGPVLDVGCGPGHLTAHLAALGVDVTGVDPVPEFVAHAVAAHAGVPFRVGAIDDLDVPDGSLAGVLAWYSLIHVTPGAIPAALAVLRRALRPGGVLVVGLFDGDRVEEFAHRVHPAYRWPVHQFEARLRAADFTPTHRWARPAEGERRPHLAVVARAGPAAIGSPS
ncbi:class I SAM-dependent DNA methyltransferase [Agilicoccus flavus]|uniref:class I SAM-dependent DNA methyltransferase n=1 Tax=Agilicoccus flavus TaxID=2775968 RepID=UPI001CF6FC4E|nr:class I SAM-dependent methyltransferase [Agilicoccus flavus]